MSSLPPARTRARTTTLATLLVAWLAAAPAVAWAAPVLEAGPVPAIAGVGGLAAELRAQAAPLLARGFAERLLAAAGEGTTLLATRDAGSLAGTLAELYAAAGQSPPRPDALPHGPLAAAVAPLVAAAADAARGASAAFAQLEPEERAFLLTRLDDLATAAGPDAERVLALLDRVDMRPMLSGAAGLARALDAFPRAAVSLPGWPSIAATCVDPSCLVVLGTCGADVYPVERVLIVEPCGNDLYTNHAASFAPGSGLPLPVSAVLDLGGDDRYLETSLGTVDRGWGSAVGIAGIGLLLDAAGNDMYRVALANEGAPCSPDPSVGFAQRQIAYGQAVGVAGVGALLDLDGNDRYEATSSYIGTHPCHWGKTYVFAQGVGNHGGVGVLLDDGGEDRYEARAHAAYVDDNLAHVHAQAASGGGVGALVDAGGDDTYLANATATLGSDPVRQKGAFAFTFAQGAVLATREDPSLAPGSPLAPAAPVDELACGHVSSVPVDQQCTGPGLALLVDVDGDDAYVAESYAAEPSVCWAVAVTSAQGSAAWSGSASLLDLGSDGGDVFRIRAVADGGCNRSARAYGQGYGGQILWSHWDQPPPDSLVPLMRLYPVRPLWTPAVGTLLNAAGTGAGDDLYDAEARAALTCRNGNVTIPCSGFKLGCAETWVQGAAGNLRDTPRSGLACTSFSGYGDTTINVPPVSIKLPTGFGVGLHVDIGGGDTFLASSVADGTLPLARTVAQGASVGGVGVLVNEGGDDRYLADARHNSVPVPPRTIAQANAQGMMAAGTVGCIVMPPVVTPCLPYAAAALAVLADTGGMDSYSEFFDPPPGAGCQVNLGSWGTIAPLTPCGAANPPFAGTVIGLDRTV